MLLNDEYPLCNVLSTTLSKLVVLTTSASSKYRTSLVQEWFAYLKGKFDKNEAQKVIFGGDVPEDQHLEALSSYLLEATARIENPIRGCTTLLASLEQKVEELQARVMALEARLEGGSSCVNPLCSFSPPGSSSRFPSLAENNVPDVIPTAVNLSDPVSGSFLRLLMSEEGVQDILSTTANLIENGALPTEVDLPSVSNLSYYQAASGAYYQATLDAYHQAASDDFLSQSSQADFVAEFVEPTSLDWTTLGDIGHDFFDYSFSDFSTILNFGADDLQIFQPFLSD
ncbi:hypothetical protein LguiB_027031 [Lonicera macranthoides]